MPLARPVGLRIGGTFLLPIAIFHSIPRLLMPRRLFLLVGATLCALVLTIGCGGSDAPSDASSPPITTTSDGVGHPEWVDDVVMYEMFIPDFTDEGTFRAAIDRFDELKDMGVNTIWLMPIHPVGEKRAKTDIGALGSPYAVRDYKGVNPQYGSAEDFQAFVDAAHERNMYVIIDWVANHTAWDHPWVSEHPEYYTDGPIDGRFTYPLLDGDTTDWTDVVDLDFSNQEMRAKMIDAMQFWVREFNIDGYRCDVAHQVPLDFWETAIDSVESVKPVLMLAEAAEPEMHDVGFDLTYAWPYYGTLKDVWENERPASALLTQVDTTLDTLHPEAHRLRFTTNHDETMWDATPLELFDGRDGSEAAFVLTTTLPGVPLMYNGQELGIADTVSFFAAQPYDWNQTDTMMPFYSTYLNLYQSSTALRDGDFEVLAPDAENVALYRRFTDNQNLIIAVNLREEATTIDLPTAYQEASLTNVLTNTTVPGSTLSLEPHGYHILAVGGS